MRIGGSLLLIALGAILKFAVATQHTHGINLGAVGVILMIVGAIGLVITLIWMSTRRRTEVIHQGAVSGPGVPAGPVERQTTYYEPPADPRY